MSPKELPNRKDKKFRNMEKHKNKGKYQIKLANLNNLLVQAKFSQNYWKMYKSKRMKAVLYFSQVQVGRKNDSKIYRSTTVIAITGTIYWKMFNNFYGWRQYKLINITNMEVMKQKALPNIYKTTDRLWLQTLWTKLGNRVTPPIETMKSFRQGWYLSPTFFKIYIEKALIKCVKKILNCSIDGWSRIARNIYLCGFIW